MDPFTLALLGGGAVLDWFGGRSQRKHSEKMTREGIAHDDKWRTRDDAWREAQWGASERNARIAHALDRVRREDMRPWREVGAGAVRTLAQAYGIPRIRMGGDPHYPEFEGVDAPATLRQLTGPRRAIAR